MRVTDNSLLVSLWLAFSESQIAIALLCLFLGYITGFSSAYRQYTAGRKTPPRWLRYMANED